MKVPFDWLKAYCKTDLDFAEVCDRITMSAAPIDVSRPLREGLFASLHAAVLTSATLAVEGSFDFFQQLRQRSAAAHLVQGPVAELGIGGGDDVGEQGHTPSFSLVPNSRWATKARSLASTSSRSRPLSAQKHP